MGTLYEKWRVIRPGGNDEINNHVTAFEQRKMDGRKSDLDSTGPHNF